MKTTRNSRKITDGMLCLFLISASVLLLTSCQKDEMPTLSSDSGSEQTTAKKRNSDSAQPSGAIQLPTTQSKGERNKSADATIDQNGFHSGTIAQPTLDQNLGGSKKMTETIGNMNPFHLGNTDQPTLDQGKNTQKIQTNTLKADIKQN